MATPRSRGASVGGQWPRAPHILYILWTMEREIIFKRFVWGLCVWSVVSVPAIAKTTSARADHARLAAAQNVPFDGVLRFLARESPLRQHKVKRAGRPANAMKLANFRIAPERTHSTQRAPFLAQTGLRPARRTHVLRAPVPPSYYPPRFPPRYPGPLFTYAGPGIPAGYAPRYHANPYAPRYEYQYPYYLYYAVPWPGWPSRY
jgi:hypothetical protein